MQHAISLLLTHLPIYADRKSKSVFIATIFFLVAET